MTWRCRKTPALPSAAWPPSLYCRVCGFEWPSSPWGDDGASPEYDICPCCEVEAGYEDYAPDSARDYRENWLAAGAPWSVRSHPHDGLTTEARLARVPPGFE